jgi:hypothetical protein
MSRAAVNWCVEEAKTSNKHTKATDGQIERQTRSNGDDDGGGSSEVCSMAAAV